MARATDATRATPAIRLRPITLEDRDEAARIAYEVFARVHDRQRVPRDLPTLEVARELIGGLIEHEAVWGIVAERDGAVVGSNFLDERSPVRGLGPITVDRAAQRGGIGRAIMEATLERGRSGRGVRLLQDAFNAQSLALYASLGFEVEDLVLLMTGPVAATGPRDLVVRPLEEGDVAACERLCVAVHGFERTRELRDALQSATLRPAVALRDGRLVAYATTLTSFGASHAVAENEAAMAALIAGVLGTGEQRASFLVPAHHHDLVRWCLASGLRVVKAMTYMVTGFRRDPGGAWLPSSSY